MELGNKIVNDIYEANYIDCSADVSDTEADGTRICRATSDCDSAVREAWIRTKYVEKTFIMSNEQLRHEEEKRLNLLRDITFTENGWFIPHGRRKKIKLRIENIEKQSNDDSASANDRNKTNEEPSSENEEQEEDEENSAELIKEEPFEHLNSDMLLYKATVVHNLPIMCYALASGASKIWTNPIDSYRSSIHQAVLSVIVKYFIL